MSLCSAGQLVKTCFKKIVKTASFLTIFANATHKTTFIFQVSFHVLGIGPLRAKTLLEFISAILSLEKFKHRCEEGLGASFLFSV